MNRRFFGLLGAALLAAATFTPSLARAADEGPEALIRRLSDQVLAAVRSDKGLQAGEVTRISAFVDSTLMPHVNFQRMTASAVGPKWREASPEQQSRLQQEFKTLLVRTYAGALAQIEDQNIVVKPTRGGTDNDVVVRTEVRGRSDPIQLDYRVERSASGDWRIYNMNVMGVWLVETYRSQFAQEISARGIDGLIGSLAERNRANAKRT